MLNKCFEFEFGGIIWPPILYFVIEIHARPQGRKIKKFLQITLLIPTPFLLYATVVGVVVAQILLEFLTKEIKLLK